MSERENSHGEYAELLRTSNRVGVWVSLNVGGFRVNVNRIKGADKTLNASVEFETYTQAEL